MFVNLLACRSFPTAFAVVMRTGAVSLSMIQDSTTNTRHPVIYLSACMGQSVYHITVRYAKMELLFDEFS